MNKLIEAILYSVGENGITPKEAKLILNTNTNTARKIIKEYMRQFNSQDSALEILELNDRFKLVTKKEYGEIIKNMFSKLRKQKLSKSALEVIGIIAYKAPITKLEINKIRGINSDGVINTLISKKLIEEIGFSEKKGKPVLYNVTKKFNDYFQIKSINELPKFNDIDESDDIETFDLFSSQRADNV